MELPKQARWSLECAVVENLWKVEVSNLVKIVRFGIPGDYLQLSCLSSRLLAASVIP